MQQAGSVASANQAERYGKILMLYFPRSPLFYLLMEKSLGVSSKSGFLLKGTVRALFKGFPTRLPNAIGIQELVFSDGARFTQCSLYLSPKKAFLFCRF